MTEDTSRKLPARIESIARSIPRASTSFSQLRQQIGLLRQPLAPHYPADAITGPTADLSGVSNYAYDPLNAVGSPYSGQTGTMAGGIFAPNADNPSPTGATTQLPGAPLAGPAIDNSWSGLFSVGDPMGFGGMLGQLPGSAIIPGTISNDQLAQPLPTTAERFQTFLASGTWTKPAWATFVRVFAIGGGGGGGSGERQALGTSVSGGGGGGGGGMSVGEFAAVDVGATVAITIGVGGAGATANSGSTAAPGQAGSDGTDSTFGSLVRGGGGKAGSGTGPAASGPGGAVPNADGGSGTYPGGLGGPVLAGPQQEMGNFSTVDGQIRPAMGAGGGGAGGMILFLGGSYTAYPTNPTAGTGFAPSSWGGFASNGGLVPGTSGGVGSPSQGASSPGGAQGGGGGAAALTPGANAAGGDGGQAGGGGGGGGAGQISGGNRGGGGGRGGDGMVAVLCW